jgi:hypothetical protein
LPNNVTYVITNITSAFFSDKNPICDHAETLMVGKFPETSTTCDFMVDSVCGSVPENLLSRAMKMAEKLCNASVHNVHQVACADLNSFNCNTEIENYPSSVVKDCGEEFLKNFTTMCRNNDSTTLSLIVMISIGGVCLTSVCALYVLCKSIQKTLSREDEESNAGHIGYNTFGSDFKSFYSDSSDSDGPYFDASGNNSDDENCTLKPIWPNIDGL